MAEEPVFGPQTEDSLCPWMPVARAELAKNIHATLVDNSMVQSLRMELAMSRSMHAVADAREQLEKETLSRPPDSRLKSLFSKPLKMDPEKLLGRMKPLKSANPEIKKYFDGMYPMDDESKPAEKRRTVSWLTGEGKSEHVTAWCAAFVHWCLVQSGYKDHLKYATARSWLTYGHKLLHPVYGCIVVLHPLKKDPETGKPMDGGATGHIGFFLERKGSKVRLLGGNQSHMVREKEYDAADVWDYRWPIHGEDVTTHPNAPKKVKAAG